MSHKSSRGSRNRSDTGSSSRGSKKTKKNNVHISTHANTNANTNAITNTDCIPYSKTDIEQIQSYIEKGIDNESKHRYSKTKNESKRTKYRNPYIKAHNKTIRDIYDIIKDKCRNLPISKIKYIYGPYYYREFQYNGRNFYFFGEIHSTRECVYPTAKKDLILFTDFVHSLVTQNPDKNFDLFTEALYRFKKSKRLKNIVALYGSIMFDLIEIYFNKYLSFNKECEYPNLRVHYTDVRKKQRIESTIKNIEMLDYNFFMPNTYYIKNLIHDVEKIIQFINEEIKIDKQFANISDAFIKAQINKYKNDIINFAHYRINILRLTTLLQNNEYILESEYNAINSFLHNTNTNSNTNRDTMQNDMQYIKVNEFSNTFEKYDKKLQIGFNSSIIIIWDIYMLSMDIYMLSRMFRDFGLQKECFYSGPTQNIITYTGAMHSKNYEYFFTKYLGLQPLYAIGDFKGDYFEIKSEVHKCLHFEIEKSLLNTFQQNKSNSQTKPNSQNASKLSASKESINLAQFDIESVNV